MRKLGLIFAVFYAPHGFRHCMFAVFLAQSVNEIQMLPVLKTNDRHVGILLPVSILAIS